MPRVDLRHCPVCRYSLAGLPPAHRCPECGFEYDAQTHVWRPSVPRHLYLMLAGAVIIGLPVGSGLIQPMRAGLPPPWPLLLACPVWIITCGLLSLRLARFAGRGWFAAMTPRGIVARTGGSINEVEWAGIRKAAAPDDLVPALQRLGVPGLQRAFDDSSEIDAFERELRRRLNSPSVDSLSVDSPPVDSPPIESSGLESPRADSPEPARPGIDPHGQESAGSVG